MKYTLMSEAALLFLPIVLLPSAFSFECSALSEGAYAECLVMKALPLEDKDPFYAALLYPEPYIPQHDIIYAYNTAIPVKEKPVGAPSKDREYIKNAWVKILAVMPSVWEDNKTFVPSNAVVRSAYGYKLDVPSSTASSDCRTKYNILKEDASTMVFVSGKQQGDGELVSITVTKDAIIESRLLISVELLVKHYRMQRDCRRCVRRCTYSWSETITEKLEVSDYLPVYHYADFPTAQLRPLYHHWGTTTTALETKDNTEITFPSSSLSEYHTVYDVFFYLKPYDFAQIRAQPFNHTRIGNLFYSNKTLSVKSNSCTITAWNHFYRITNTCNLSKARELSSAFITKGYPATLVFLFVLFIILFPAFRMFLRRN